MRGLLLAALLLPVLDRLAGANLMPAAAQIVLYIMMAHGLNLIVGYSGLLHLGYTAFVAVGALLMAWLTSMQSPLAMGMSFYLAVPCCVLITALLGALLAWPVLKLRGDYLAIVTMGFGLMLPPLLRHYDAATRAITGISGIAAPYPGPSYAFWYYFLLFVLLAVIGVAYRVRHSSFGRALRAMREDPIAAQACGISLSRTKLQVLTLGAAIAGLAGSLHSSYMITFTLSFPFDFNGSIMILAMVILGGVGSIRGVTLGALGLGTVNLVLTPALIDWMQQVGQPHLAQLFSSMPALWARLEPWLDPSKAQFLIYGMTLVAMMLLRPEGLVPEEPVAYPEEAR